MSLLPVELGNTEERCLSQETKLVQEWVQALCPVDAVLL